eukprot:11154917-Lingulodinium_polyedra.AAC.1
MSSRAARAVVPWDGPRRRSPGHAEPPTRRAVPACARRLTLRGADVATSSVREEVVAAIFSLYAVYAAGP